MTINQVSHILELEAGGGGWDSDCQGMVGWGKS